MASTSPETVKDAPEATQEAGNGLPVAFTVPTRSFLANAKLLNAATDEQDDADENLTLLQQALQNYADGLSGDLSGIRDRISDIADMEDVEEITGAIKDLQDDLPDLLKASLASTAASKALADSMGTLYHNGLVSVDDGLSDADQTDAENADSILPIGKIAGLVLTAGLLTSKDDVNGDISDILDRADWATAATKANLVDGLNDDLGDAGLLTEQDSILTKLGDILAGITATGLINDGIVAIGNDTQNQMAFGYGSQQMMDDNTEDYPACELFRQWDRKEWRDWPARWEAAGGEFFPHTGDENDMQFGGYPEGRMIALTNDPIWLEISRFGTPYSPYDYNSGMERGPISFDEAVQLGLIDAGATEVPEPSDTDGFNDSVQFSADVSPDIKDAFLGYLGKDFSEQDGVIANHSVRKDVLLNAGTSEGAIKGWQNRNHSIASEIHGVVPTDAPVQTKTFYHVTRQENAPSILEKGFDINKTRAQWMNDHAISFSPTLKAAMKYFSPNAGPNERKFDHSKYAVLEAKVRGRKLSDDAAPAIGESSDPRDYTQRVIRRGYDWADRGSKYVYNPRAIVSVRQVLPEEMTNSISDVFHPDPLPKQYSALLNAAHAKAGSPKVTPTLHGLFHRVN